MEIVVDRSRCTAIGICESIAPQYFEVGDDGQMHQLIAEPAPADKATIDEAVRSCPALALKLVEN
jgi:ferredoxin